MKQSVQFFITDGVHSEYGLNKVTPFIEDRPQDAEVLLMLVLAPGINGIMELVAVDKIFGETLIEVALVHYFDLIEVACFTEQFEQARFTALGCGQTV